MFSKNNRYLFPKEISKKSHANELYIQTLVVAQYQFMIRCYSAMFRSEI